jgi:PPOX class probable F420-dependent enzyme
MKLKEFSEFQYINLVTFKKNGSEVITPVWVAEYDNSLVVTTSANAGKVKRVRNNGRAIIYKTNQSGSQKLSEELNVVASLIEVDDLKDKAVAVIKEKYGLMAKMMIKGSNSNRAIIKLDQL